ncbi:uncharacterized protein I303_102427 [Kwoniella dejecticola CBS 10117]|uniref:Uncharacterized protein n=1 Tax=Kwoniella dejecticola CBS 10117 TaxID=1296121 RepID=A0A1A6A8Q3_9TREE|nr:uncharacterized protein I303_02442 [Kwoniella dejecticola CBS 10117]OBR86435.1 hypothetical protein I303_02442 [Kwoniella dejecticola CBS 10117]
MFAPRSTHIPRTYSVYQQPTTSKKNTNKENANALPSKTPSRAGKGAMRMGPSTGLRMGLGVKTEGRDRNVLMQQNQGVGGKGKGQGQGQEGEDIGPKRLFAQGSSKSASTSTSIPPSKSLSSMPHIQLNPTHSGMQTHKTPARSSKKQAFQTLRTPAPAPAPASMREEPAPTPLPSATRARRRSRASLSSISLTPIKSSIEQNFVTPAPVHVQWEEELSLGSIEETTNEVLQNVQEEVEVEGEVEDDYEPEYMPPPVQELPYTPAYDHPDLVSIFSTLSKLPPLWSYNDDVIIREIPPFEIEDVEVEHLQLKSDEDLEEDWLKPKPKSNPNPIQKPVVPVLTRTHARFDGTGSINASQARKQAPTIGRFVTGNSRTAKPDLGVNPTSAVNTSRLPGNRISTTTTSRSTAVPPVKMARTTRPPIPSIDRAPVPPAARRNLITAQRAIPSKGATVNNTANKPTKKVDVGDQKLLDSWQDDDVLDFGFELELQLDIDLD